MDRASPWRRCWFRLALALLALLTVSGCQTGGVSPWSRWRMTRDWSIAKPIGRDEFDGADRALMARWLSNHPHTPEGDATPKGLVLGPEGWNVPRFAPDPEADTEFQAAEQLFQQGKLAEAETAFARLAKKRQGTPWGESAQFYLAETQFQRGRYVAAHDNFERLIADYPATRYLDKLVEREFAIAEIWLAYLDQNADSDEPETAGDDTGDGGPRFLNVPTETDRFDPARIAAHLPWTARFTKGLPLVDIRGHALAVLEHVRHNDPTGPLADQAALRIADVYYHVQDYESASDYYDQLIAEHPKSPLLQKAQLASIDAKIKAYLGPEYDGEGLEQARQLIRQTMTTFPDRPASHDDLYHTLDLINDQDAERTFRVGEYYRRTGHIISAEYYFGKIPRHWPRSPWAARAKEQLAELATLPRKPSQPRRMMGHPGRYEAQAGGGLGLGGMGMPMGGAMGGLMP